MVLLLERLLLLTALLATALAVRNISTTIVASRTTTTPHKYDPSERKCACQPSKLYLDIVVVIDTSLSMTKEGLVQVTFMLIVLV
ncbi:hypothetical protein Tcan_15045 [Toxocara canis]|uniref:VWFA domain-containing protein n=1 Tax=Toxocara canis TaxID=6265 RepID=A0A0B2VRS3_TOXCA|nr:hypothetical protein Tcan_15045 [Toxocara canis]